jgi:hypothetical protein
MGYN